MLGGLAVRLNLTIENLEDLQIALDSLLERTDATTQATSRCGWRCATARSRPSSGRSTLELLDEIERDAGDELGLRRVLESTVDDVHVDGDSVRLTKRVAARG